MQPGIDLRLRTMMKALSEVVMPAIDPVNRMAMEQAGVILGSLDFLREQIDYAHWYEAADLMSLCNLAADLEGVDALQVAPELSSIRTHGASIATRWDVALPALRQASAELREAISLTVEAAFAQPDTAIRSAVQRLVLEQSRDQLGRERAFVAGTKWDGFPETLRTIEASLRQFRPTDDRIEKESGARM